MDDLDWLAGVQFGAVRASLILRGVLTKSSDVELRRIPRQLADGVLASARLGLADFSAEALGRILSEVPSSCDSMLQIALARPNELANAAGLRFVQLLLTRVLGEAASRPLAVEAVNQFARYLPARELALMAAYPTLRTEQVSSNLLLFEAVSEEVRWHLASRADVLTEQIVSRRALIPSAEAISAWAGFISEAGRHAGGATSLRAASVALEFALSATRVQVSPLLRVAFPRVYAHLRSTEATPSILSFFSFQDWDRCKTARKDLVRAFTSSVWPPADLLRIADEVMEVESFSWLLGNLPSGRDYLARALADPSLPLEIRNAFSGRA